MSTGKKDIILIFSGYNTRAVIAFLRTLAQNKIENYAIAALSDEDMIFQTAYKEKVLYVRKKEELDLEEFCFLTEYICRETGNERAFMIPSTEALNRFMLHNRKYLEEHRCVIPLADESLYIKISDKESFCSLCRKYFLPVPEEMTPGNRYTKPFAAKPRKYLSRAGKALSPVLIQSAAEFEAFMRDCEKEDFLFQELVTGESYYLLYYFSEGGKAYCMSQQNLVQQPDGKSIVAACCSTMHLEEPAAGQYENMFIQEGFRGLVMVELRKHGGQYIMIEANPRLWGPSQLFCDCGCNFFEYFLHDYHFIPQIPSRELHYEAKYFWGGGMDLETARGLECVYHPDKNNTFSCFREQFAECDIYRREDTMEIYRQERKEIHKAAQAGRLKALYMESGKHSGYQILPDCLKDFLAQQDLNIKSRQEKERFAYICGCLDFTEKKVLDIGGNTGFFSFESIAAGACHVDYYEGNAAHAEFAELSCGLLNLKNRITVYPEYYVFQEKKRKYDIVLCLNVLHHLGSDFEPGYSMEKARERILCHINSLSEITEYLVLQLGFNWCGDRERCLFPNGTKQEMERYIMDGTADFWEICRIGTAELHGQEIRYNDINDSNNDRNDMLGEFLNRPVFIMRSKRSPILKLL